MKVMRLSLGRRGGVVERPGEAEGVATGVGRRLLRRMDWGVKLEKTGTDAANARALWKTNNQRIFLQTREENNNNHHTGNSTIAVSIRR